MKSKNFAQPSAPLSFESLSSVSKIDVSLNPKSGHLYLIEFGVSLPWANLTLGRILNSAMKLSLSLSSG
jgi:hypothetical protein